MPFSIGTSAAKKVYWGTAEVKKIFDGTTQKWANDPYEPFIYFPETNSNVYLKLHKMNKSDLSIASSVTLSSGVYNTAEGIYVDDTYVYVSYGTYVKKCLKSNLVLVATSSYVGGNGSNKAVKADSSNVYVVQQTRLLVLAKSTMQALSSYYSFPTYTQGIDIEPGSSHHIILSSSIVGSLNSSTMALDSSVSAGGNALAVSPGDIYIAKNDKKVARHNRINFGMITTSASLGEIIYRIAISDQVYVRGKTKIKKLDWLNLSELYGYTTTSGLALAVDNEFVYVEDAGKIKKLSTANLSYVSQSSATFTLINCMAIRKA